MSSRFQPQSPDGTVQWSKFAPLDAAVVARAARSATSKETRTGAENTGDHLIEVVLDNRSGGLYPLLEVLLAGPIVMPDGSPIDADELAGFIGKVDTITAAADYHAGVCSVNVELTCAAGVSAKDVETMHSLLAFCSHFVAATLRASTPHRCTAKHTFTSAASATRTPSRTLDAQSSPSTTASRQHPKQGFVQFIYMHLFRTCTLTPFTSRLALVHCSSVSRHSKHLRLGA